MCDDFISHCRNRTTIEGSSRRVILCSEDKHVSVRFCSVKTIEYCYNNSGMK
jgi:hypothetical protein